LYAFCIQRIRWFELTGYIRLLAKKLTLFRREFIDNASISSTSILTWHFGIHIAWGGNCSLHGSIISTTYTPGAKERPKRRAKTLSPEGYKLRHLMMWNFRLTEYG
jgi:hypothetical protein